MILSSLFATTVFAEDYDTQIEEAQQEAEQADQEVHNLEEQINSLNEEVGNTEAALAELEAEIARNEARVDEAIEQLEAAYAEMETLQAEIEVLEENIAERTEQLEEQARKLQVDGQPANYIEFIIDAESLSDIIGRIDIVSNLVRNNRNLVNAQVRDMEAVVEKTERTEQTIVQQNALASELEGIAEDLEQQQLEQEVLVAQLAAERATAEGEREAYLAQRAAAEQQVTQLVADRESARQAAIEAEEQRRREEQEAQAREEEAQARAEAEEQQESSESSATEQPVQTSSSNSTPPAQPAQSSNNGGSTGSGSTSSGSSSNGSTSNGGSSNGGSSSGGSTSNGGSSSGNSGSTGNNSGSEQPSTPSQPSTPPAQTGGGASWSNLRSIGESVMGTPYVWGGGTPSGFDCSGFTQWVFRQAGVSIPRTSSAQYANSRRVDNPQPGDLVFFGSGGSVTHVGIYAGGGRFLGAQTSTGVAYASTTSGYWASRVIGYGRY